MCLTPPAAREAAPGDMSLSKGFSFQGKIFSFTGELPRKKLEPILKSKGAKVRARNVSDSSSEDILGGIHIHDA